MYMHIVYPGFHGKLRQCDARLNEFEWLDELRELKGVWYLVESTHKKNDTRDCSMEKRTIVSSIAGTLKRVGVWGYCQNMVKGVCER